MARAIQTRPFDLVVAARLLRPARTIAEIAEPLRAAPSQVHASLGRLRVAGLLKAESRATNPRALVEFVVGGVRYAFPALRGPITQGVPTAYSAAPLSAVLDAPDALVWPAAKAPGATKGFALTPLYPRAPLLRESDPPTYQILCVIDAMRLGEHRLRQHARDALERLVIG